MSTFFKQNLRKKNWNREIDPDEVLIDATNLPRFDQSQFEGRLEKPLPKWTVIGCGIVCALILASFTVKISILQISEGESYAERSAKNSLRQTLIIPERGIIYDRNNELLASNTYDKDAEFPRRVYADAAGLAHVLGYIRYPARDSNGFYYQDHYEGLAGVEKIYDPVLAGKKGTKIIETDAFGKVSSESVVEPPANGTSLILSIDKRVQQKLYELIKTTATDVGFDGGGGILIDARTGEILALSSFPEYDSNIMSDKTNTAAIRAFSKNKQKPFLNRVTDGLYTPGSIVKPFIALGALKEGVIDPKTKILSTGSISIQNPFDTSKKSVFKDWRPQGLVDMRAALAVSSDVYFYEIGGGFENQPGLGIEHIGTYMRMFGFGEIPDDHLLLTRRGSIPSPAWKAENFPGDPWRVGDTYNTAIGQYGFQVTALQAVRATAAIANGGTLLDPTLLKTDSPRGQSEKKLPFTQDEIAVVQEGMRQAVTDGTAKGLNIPQVEIAAKTGTAELGTAKKYVNSWVIGFLPYRKPRFAFAAIMEKGPYDNTIGGLYVMRKLFEWMAVNTPEYLKQIPITK